MNRLAGARIAPNPRCAVHNLEAAKSANFNAVPTSQCVVHGIKNDIDCELDIY